MHLYLKNRHTFRNVGVLHHKCPFMIYLMFFDQSQVVMIIIEKPRTVSCVKKVCRQCSSEMTYNISRITSSPLLLEQQSRKYCIYNLKSNSFDYNWIHLRYAIHLSDL